MPKLNLSQQLSEIARNYKFVKDTEGMSPAQVYKLIGRRENLYLKMSDEKYRGTTYDVEREKEIMLWLRNKLPVPEVLHFEQHEGTSFLLMTEIEGVMGSEDYEQHRDPKRMIQFYSGGIKQFQSINAMDCPFDNGVKNRLDELDYLLSRKLADVDISNWEEDTPFHDPNELYDFLRANQPKEDLVFSHGDFGDSNLFIRNDQVNGFIDLGRSGKADKWYDIAFCVRSIRNDLGDDQEYLDFFFDQLGTDPDWEKINYFILLDEMF